MLVLCETITRGMHSACGVKEVIRTASRTAIYASTSTLIVLVLDRILARIDHRMTVNHILSFGLQCFMQQCWEIVLTNLLPEASNLQVHVLMCGITNNGDGGEDM